MIVSLVALFFTFAYYSFIYAIVCSRARDVDLPSYPACCPLPEMLEAVCSEIRGDSWCEVFMEGSFIRATTRRRTGKRWPRGLKDVEFGGSTIDMAIDTTKKGIGLSHGVALRSARAPSVRTQHLRAEVPQA